jgi:hypothetical protein
MLIWRVQLKNNKNSKKSINPLAFAERYGILRLLSE